MIEKCNICQKDHDVGDESPVNDIPFKTCPMLPDDAVFLFNPAEYLRLDNDGQTVILLSGQRAANIDFFS